MFYQKHYIYKLFLKLLSINEIQNSLYHPICDYPLLMSVSSPSLFPAWCVLVALRTVFDHATLHKRSTIIRWTCMGVPITITEINILIIRKWGICIFFFIFLITFNIFYIMICILLKQTCSNVFKYQSARNFLGISDNDLHCYHKTENTSYQS